MRQEHETSVQNERLLAPITDIYETEDNFTMLMEMPGVEKDNLNIILEDESLEVKGTVNSWNPEGLNLKYSDRPAGSYYRKFRVGNDIDRNGIDAKLSEGTLTLTLNKAEEVKPKKIEITAH